MMRFSTYQLIVAAIFCGCFFFSSCENSKQEIANLTLKNVAIETGKDVTILYTIGSYTKAKITAPLMLRHVEDIPFIEFTKTIHADFFNADLQIESRLSAHYAKYYEREAKVFLRDSVVVYNSKGDTLYCDELYWDRTRTGHEFYTDKPVRIRTPTHIIDGDGLDAPQDFKSWHIINGRGTVRVPSTDLPE